jgi:DNA repair protein SbcC/Rad50
MRPLKLRLENFASYRGQATELDFSSLELFAISGPTGAGKSTLLDAIIFALYGSVPRLGRRATEIISLGADRMSVVFDFRIDAQRYRVTRLARRKGAGAAQLEQVAPDDEMQPLKEGVREVNEAAARLVGLSYEAFTQAVVLPQGEFQRFLKSEPRERREILSKILRLEIYERMRRLASGKSDMLAQAVQERERRLDEDYAEATPAALHRLTEQADHLSAECKVLVGRLSEAEARRDAIRASREKTRELEQRRLRFNELQADEPRTRSHERQLAAARRAAPIQPLIRAASAGEQNAARAKHDHDALVQRHARLRAEHKEAESQLTQAVEQKAEIPLLEERIAALDQVIGRMQPRPALGLQLAATRREKLSAERKLKEARAENEKAAKDLTTARANLSKADTALAAAKFDRALFETLDATREDASRIGNLRHAATLSAAEVRAAKGRLKTKEEACARANGEAEAAEQQWKRASQRALDVDREFAEARHRNAAALLRRELRIGEPCPVCEHPVAEHSPPLPTPMLDALERRFEQARRAESKTRELKDEARAAVAAAEAAVAAEQQTIEQSNQRCNAAEAELAKACESLATRLRGAIVFAEERHIEEQLREKYQAILMAKQRHEAARTEHDGAEEAVRKADQNTQRLETMVATAIGQLAQHDNRIADLTRQIAEIDEEIRKVTQASDPQEERAQLNRRRDSIGEVLQDRQSAETTTARELAGVTARLEASSETCNKANTEAQRARTEARDAALAAGFTDEAGAAQAEITAAEEQHISTHIETHRHEMRTVQVRIDELIGELGGAEVAEETLTAAESAATRLRAELSTSERSQAELNTRIEILIKDIDRAKELRDDLERQRVEHSLYRSLTLDLRSDRFQAFLLDETFRELVSGASIRLWDLTKRYRFDWQHEAFYVVDHDNARQLRSADTLSGGETFLASLALALQLSEQVQKAAGATKLDSLFIDEGFGTLDPEALDAAAGAIESLPVGGRMVGIISHIDELSLRLPARVRVSKTPEGSRLMLEAS